MAAARSLLDYVSCYYDECVPPEDRRRAYASARLDVVRYAAELWRVRAPEAESPAASGLPVFPGYSRPRLRFLAGRELYKYVRDTYHRSPRRLLAFMYLSNMYYHNNYGEIVLNGKLLEIILYTRYRRTKARSRNDVFSLRMWVPVPINFTCENTVVRYATHAAARHYLRQLALALLSRVIWPAAGRVVFDPMACEARRPNYSECIKVYGQAAPDSPLAEAYRLAATVGQGNVSVDEDRERIAEAIYPTYYAPEIEALLEDFEEVLAINDVLAGCRELPPEVKPFDRAASARVLSAFERAWLSGRCHDVSQALGLSYCGIAGSYYMYPTGAAARKLRLPQVGHVRGTYIGGFTRIGIIEYPYALWAQGSLKASLLAPVLAFVERVTFTEGALEEALLSAGPAPPAEAVRRIYEAVVGSLAPPDRLASIADSLRSETFEAVLIPLNFYDLVGRLVFP